MGIPLLDSNGYVTEIRITQRGRNFVPNRPENVNCVLDSLTLTRPGSGYTVFLECLSTVSLVRLLLELMLLDL